MCGRFSLTVAVEVLIEHFQLKKAIHMKSRYNIAPSEQIPVLKVPGEIDFLQWGFKPQWMERPEGSVGFINARCETVHQKPSFRNAFQKRRCLVLADGYYEWKKIGRIKQPFYIRRQDRQPFAFGGIWEAETCAILTTIATPRLAQLHPRMPLILPLNAYSSWLNPRSSLAEILPLLFSAAHEESEDLEVYPVSSKVNDPRFEGPECICSLS